MKRPSRFTGIAMLVAGAGVLIVLAGPANIAHLQAVRQLSGESAIDRAALQPAMPYFRGLVDQKAGDLISAEAEFNEALQTRHEPFAGAHLVEIWLKQGSYASILAYLDTGLPLDEGLARKLIAETVRNVPSEESQRWFDVVKQRYPGALLPASKEFLIAGRYAEAAMWSGAVNDSSQKMEALLVSGISTFYQGKLDESESIFSQLHEKNPTPESEYWYGRLLTLNGRPQFAVPILEGSVREASVGLLPWALRELGSAYALAGRCQDANAAFARSIEVDNSVDNHERIQQARENIKSICNLK